MENLVKDFEELVTKLQVEGYNVIAVLSKYGPSDAEFHSYLKTHEEENISLDHIVLDAVREISVDWSNAVHEAKLEWEV